MHLIRLSLPGMYFRAMPPLAHCVSLANPPPLSFASQPTSTVFQKMTQRPSLLIPLFFPSLKSQKRPRPKIQDRERRSKPLTHLASTLNVSDKPGADVWAFSDGEKRLSSLSSLNNSACYNFYEKWDMSLSLAAQTPSPNV